MLKKYIQLQYKMSNRQLKALGVNPILGYVLLVVVFIALSESIFYKFDYADYLFAALALGLMTKFSEIKRNDFLKTCFGDTHYHKIRMVENMLVTLPFVFIFNIQAKIHCYSSSSDWCFGYGIISF